MKIRCPKCCWNHDWGEHWSCEQCSATFDTFITKAHCPVCPNTWDFTACPECSVLSPHLFWYVDGDGSARTSSGKQADLPLSVN